MDKKIITFAKNVCLSGPLVHFLKIEFLQITMFYEIQLSQHEILILITLANGEGSDKPVRMPELLLLSHTQYAYG